MRTQVRPISRLAPALPYAHLDDLRLRGSVDLAEEMGLHQRGPETREEHPDAADDQPESADEIGQHSEQEGDDVIGQVIGDKTENLTEPEAGHKLAREGILDGSRRDDDCHQETPQTAEAVHTGYKCSYGFTKQNHWR